MELKKWRRIQREEGKRKDLTGSEEHTRQGDKRKGGRERGREMKSKGRGAGLHIGRADVQFLIPPVRGFVPRPSRKSELGRQQLTKELWRIQLAVNGQPQAFVPVTMETAQHHHTKITKHFSALLLFLSSSPFPLLFFPLLMLLYFCPSFSVSLSLRHTHTYAHTHKHGCCYIELICYGCNSTCWATDR